jgi:hypothetical protein
MKAVKRDLTNVGSAAPLSYANYAEAIGARATDASKSWALQPLRVATLIRLSLLNGDD